MSIFKDGLIRQGASGATGIGYKIDQSIRFNDDDTAYMSKTISSTSSRTTWTFSTWFKLANASINVSFCGLFSAVWNSSNFVNIAFSNSSTYCLDFLLYNSNSTIGRLNAKKLLRDPSAWYHLVAVLDTTNDQANERMRLYINGERLTSFSTNTTPSKDATPLANYATAVHSLGRAYNAGTYSGYYYDGYMAEIHFVDGYAYGPGFFGEFEENGIWIPKEYEGSYGTNGFYIDGRDSSDLGDDESGQNNDYTTSGLSADDQQPDSPTNNHAVFNPLDVTHHGYTVFSEGNLAVIYSGSNARELARSTIKMPANTDAFFEVKMTATLGSGVDFALGIEDGSGLQDASNTTYSNAYVIREDGGFSTTGSTSTTSYGVSFTNNDVIGVWRKANGDLLFYKNGAVMNSGTPAVTGVTGEMHFVAGGFNGGAGIARFASSQWTNTPTGVSSSMALNSTNLGS